MKEKVKNNVTKEERRQMKQKLFRWGRTVEFCRNKQREKMYLFWGKKMQIVL